MPPSRRVLHPTSVTAVTAPPGQSDAHAGTVVQPVSTGLTTVRGGRNRLTLLDVAQALGVTRTTVSNAFNRPEKLSVALREEILARSQQLGYYGPDPTARALRRREIAAVGVVFHHDLSFALTDPTAQAFLGGVAAELDRRQLALHVIPKMGRRVIWAAAFQSTADGLIVHAEIGPSVVRELQTMSKPTVLVDAQVEGVPSVLTDDRQGAEMAMRHALQSRPDRVVILGFEVSARRRSQATAGSDPPRSGYVGDERMVGYLRAAEAAGFPADRLHWVEVDDHFPDAAGDRLLALLPRLPIDARVAVVAMTDRMALSALEVTARWGRPSPVAVVGFDDIPAAAVAGLTSVRQDSRTKGERAVRLLLDDAGATSAPVPTELIVRKT